jgi:hypothetical protein
MRKIAEERFCELYMLKSFRNQANDSVYKSYIDKISDTRKSEIKDYVISKLNISKERV